MAFGELKSFFVKKRDQDTHSPIRMYELVSANKGTDNHFRTTLWVSRRNKLQVSSEPGYPSPSKKEKSSAVDGPDNHFRLPDSVPDSEGQKFGLEDFFRLREAACGEVVPGPREKPLEEKRVAPVESDPVLKKKNVNITYNKDKLVMGKGNIAHFVSADGNFDSKVNKELIGNLLFDPQSLKKEQPKVGGVVIYSRKNRFIFSLILKNKQDDKVFLNTIARVILALKNWLSIEQIFQQDFEKTNLHVIVWSAENITLPLHKRDEITMEFNESVTGGHKGISKT